MNMSSSYLSHLDGLSDVDPNVISSKYSVYMLANTGDNLMEMLTFSVETTYFRMGSDIYRQEERLSIGWPLSHSPG